MKVLGSSGEQKIKPSSSRSTVLCTSKFLFTTSSFANGCRFQPLQKLFMRQVLRLRSTSEISNQVRPQNPRHHSGGAPWAGSSYLDLQLQQLQPQNKSAISQNHKLSKSQRKSWIGINKYHHFWNNHSIQVWILYLHYIHIHVSLLVTLGCPAYGWKHWGPLARYKCPPLWPPPGLQEPVKRHQHSAANVWWPLFHEDTCCFFWW